MMLLLILLVPLLGGLVAFAAERVSPRIPRWVALAAMAVDFILVVLLWYTCGAGRVDSGPWLEEFQASWLPRIGVSFHLGVDGITVILTGLTAFLGCMSVLASWSEIKARPGFFFLCLTWTLAGVLGVFLALDLFLFYFAWELMLVPMFFLIAIWGHEDRFRASIKFFVFTQLSGLLMLLSVLGLYLLNGRSTGVYTFDYVALLHTSEAHGYGPLLLLGFLAAFLVKLPAVPFHTWLPDAHTQAPTAGSVILAGLLLKTGAYGLFRFALPLLPEAAERASMFLGVMGVVGILYGAFLAFAQNDIKRLVAYTSVSHMGFVLLGIAVGGRLGLQGAVIQIVSHGVSTGALFILAGSLQQRLGTRDLRQMGGLWSAMPWMGGAAMFFALAALGLPGLGNFVGEFLIVLGVFRVSPSLAAAAAVGFVLSTAYALRMMHLAFFGGNPKGWMSTDLGMREKLMMALMMVPLLWVGLFPQWFLDRVGGSSYPINRTSQVSTLEEGRK